MRPGRWAHCTIPEPQATRYKDAPLPQAQVITNPPLRSCVTARTRNLLDWQVFWIGNKACELRSFLTASASNIWLTHGNSLSGRSLRSAMLRKNPKGQFDGSFAL